MRFLFPLMLGNGFCALWGFRSLSIALRTRQFLKLSLSFCLLIIIIISLLLEVFWLSKTSTEGRSECLILLNFLVQIFSPYGRVDDVYLMRDEMKQSRGTAVPFLLVSGCVSVLQMNICLKVSTYGYPWDLTPFLECDWLDMCVWRCSFSFYATLLWWGDGWDL